jgi:diguanylate cyclase (GGDEF)-like protein
VEESLELEIFDPLPDVVLAFDEALTIKYVNPFARWLLEHEDTPLTDQSLVDFLHPDDLGRAAEVAGLIAHDSLQTYTTPALYRARTRTGRWVSVEINATSRVESGPLAGLIVVVGRYNGDNLIRDRILEMLTAGTPTDEIVQVIPEYGLWRHPTDQYAVTYVNAQDETVSVGSAGALDLLGRFPGDDAPWTIAVRENREVLQQWDDLPDDLRDAAGELGMRGCMVLPVHDRLHDVLAIVIGWSSRLDQDVGAHRYALEQMARSLDIIMQWRGHITGLERAARFDALSGLANRGEFFRHCHTALDGARRTGHGVAVLYLDLDGFKAVNDTSGHAHGDAVITGAASRVSAAVRRDDVVARLGGDEFAVLCMGGAEPDEITAMAERIIGSLSEPFEHQGIRSSVGVSIGIAIAAPDERDPDALVARADAALYQAKTTGKGRWVLA